MDKIGLHISGGYPGPLGRPRVVKLIDVSLEYVREVRQSVGPECIIIVRWVDNNSYPLDSPVKNAADWFADHVDRMRAMADGDPNIIFEGYNEIADNSAAAYCAFEVERLRLMHQAGLRSAVGSFSIGTPHESLWGTTYKPMLQAMGPGDLLGLHEYWETPEELDNRWLCGRWTLMPELKSVPIVITEVAHGGEGWQHECPGGPAQYLEELARYNTIMEASPNVLGGTVYTTGATGDSSRGYDPAPIWPQVIGAYSGKPWTDPSRPKPPADAYYCTERVDATGKAFTPQYIVVHGTDAARDAALASWKASSNSATPTSAHDLVGADGRVVHCVPYEKAALHLGAGAQLPGLSGVDPNLASIAVAFECPAAPSTPAWPRVQVDVAVAHVRKLAETYNVPRERILRHVDVDPQNATDPRGFPWPLFVARVYQYVADEFSQATRNAAWNAGGIPYNREAAFPRFAREEDLGNPETPEFDYALNGVCYRGQGFSKGIVYAQVGEWDRCDFIPW